MISLDERMRVGSDGIAMLMPRPGVSLSAANLIELMLRVSDNTASDMLIADLGGTRAVQAWLDRNHVSGVRIDRTIARLVLDNLGLPILPGKTAAETLWASEEPSDEVQAKVAAGFDADPRDNATPIGMARFLARLDRDLLGPKEREFMLDVMSRCETGKDRLRALLPEGTRVEHKTGTLTGVSDDVGIIRLAGGRPLIVAVFTKGIADGKARAKIIAEVGKAAFDAYQPIALRGP
jgi:beta-lactamase class A